MTQPIPLSEPAERPGVRSFRSEWTHRVDFLDLCRKHDWFPYLEPSTLKPGGRIEIDGHEMLNFASNDYLGLALHPEVIEGAVRATQRWGASSSGSPSVCGQTPLHEELAARVAAATGQEAAMLFPSGFQGNVGVISAMVRSGDHVLLDRLDHASILDGSVLSGASVRFFRHNAPDSLERRLARLGSGRRLVVVESVYSMDGDECDLERICDVAERHDALVIVDEAHSFGLHPPDGRGMVTTRGLEHRVGLVYGTLGKALGSQGGFLAGPADAIEFARNQSRGYVFSTAPAPALVGAALAALDVIEREPERIEHLERITRRLHAGLRGRGFDLGATTTPITPILLPHPERNNGLPATLLGMEMRRRGVCGQVITMPAVPIRRSRIRLQVRGDLSESDVDHAVEVTDAAARAVGFFE